MQQRETNQGGFSFMGGTKGTLPYPSKNDQMPLNHSPFPTKFLFSPHGPLESKKIVVKFYQNKKKNSACSANFYKDWKFITMKGSQKQKTFSQHPCQNFGYTPSIGRLSPPYWPHPSGEHCVGGQGMKLRLKPVIAIEKRRQ